MPVPRRACAVRENESKSAGDRVCPANRKPRRKVKKRGRQAEARYAREALITRYGDFTRARTCGRKCTLCKLLPTRRSHAVSFTARRCSTRVAVSRLATLGCDARVETVTLIPRRYFARQLENFPPRRKNLKINCELRYRIPVGTASLCISIESSARE